MTPNRKLSGWTGTAPGRHHLKASSLLARLGVEVRGPAYSKQRGGKKHVPLWNRPWGEIQDVLIRASKVYRAKVKATHPDNGGRSLRMAALNTLWKRIRQAFARRGFTLD